MVSLVTCTDQGNVTTQQQTSSTIIVNSDSALFSLVTRTQSFRTYRLFPRVDSVTVGTLNGSTAHRPLVRVSMNAIAFSALRNDTLPAGAAFPDGSIIFKEIKDSVGLTLLYAVIYKERSNAFAETTSGWLWAEYYPDGSTIFSITTRGSGCIGCHSREQGPQNDFVRTFERQRHTEEVIHLHRGDSPNRRQNISTSF
jgi:hypothetical protein